MSKYIRLILLTFIVAINTYSQSTDSKSSEEKNSLQKHSWSVQFGVGNDFRLQSFQGLMVSLKYHITGHSSLRFGIGFSGSEDDGTITNDYVSESPIYGNHQNLYSTLSFIYYFKPTALINIYAGLGPRFSYYHSYNVHWYIDPGDDQMGKFETLSWRAGLQGTFGAEWFPVKFLSIFAEYFAYGVYGETKDRYRVIDSYGIPYSEDYNATNWEFNGTSAMMGLSVYF